MLPYLKQSATVEPSGRMQGDTLSRASVPNVVSTLAPLLNIRACVADRLHPSHSLRACVADWLHPSHSFAYRECSAGVAPTQPCACALADTHHGIGALLRPCRTSSPGYASSRRLRRCSEPRGLMHLCIHVIIRYIY